MTMSKMVGLILACRCSVCTLYLSSASPSIAHSLTHFSTQTYDYLSAVNGHWSDWIHLKLHVIFLHSLTFGFKVLWFPRSQSVILFGCLQVACGICLIKDMEELWQKS